MFSYLKFFCVFIIKVTFMWIEKAWVNDCLHVSIVSFVYKQNTLQLSNLKTGIAMTAKSSALAICLEAITYLLLYNLHDCTFNVPLVPSSSVSMERLKDKKYVRKWCLLLQFVIFNPWKVPWNWIAFYQNLLYHLVCYITWLDATVDDLQTRPFFETIA